MCKFNLMVSNFIGEVLFERGFHAAVLLPMVMITFLGTVHLSELGCLWSQAVEEGAVVRAEVEVQVGQMQCSSTYTDLKSS